MDAEWIGLVFAALVLIGSILWLPVWVWARVTAWEPTLAHERRRSRIEWWATVSILIATLVHVIAMALVAAMAITTVVFFFVTLINLCLAVTCYGSLYDRSEALGRALRERLCGHCGYDTNGLPDRCAVCPECGTTLPRDVPEPALPVPLDCPRPGMDPRAGDRDPVASRHHPPPPPAS